MPNLPSDSNNFIQNLSDFWLRFFQDTAQVKAFFEGAQIQIAQVYLELLQDVLSTNLEHIPLFSKEYFKLLTIREDNVVFEEGKNSDFDRYRILTSDKYAQATHLMNRIISPDNVLDYVLHFDIDQHAIRLFKDPFNYTQFDETLPGFAVRMVPVHVKTTFNSIHGLDFRLAIKPGDLFRVTLQNGTSVESKIAAVHEAQLFFHENLNALRIDFLNSSSIRSWNYTVLRKPFDYVKENISLPTTVTNVTDLVVHRVLNTSTILALRNATIVENPVIFSATQLTATNSNLNWVGKSIAISDPGNPTNDGVYTVISVVGNIVTTNAVFTAVSSNSVRATVGFTTDPAWVGQFILLADTNHATNFGYYKIIAHLSGVNDQLNSSNFVPTVDQFKAFRVSFSDNSYQTPTFSLGQTYLTKSTVKINAIRYANRVIQNVTYPAGENVIEGVDYTVNYTTGEITYLWVVNPNTFQQASYEWNLLQDFCNFNVRGTWNNVGTYGLGDIVVHNNLKWVCIVTTATIGSFLITQWKQLIAPFVFDQTYTFKEIGCWIPDALLDQDQLYNNFGYLLAEQRPTSEQYRAFLQGISRLFLLGPSLERMESALNVVCNLPVIHSNNEVLKQYRSGYESLGGSSLSNITGNVQIGNFGEIVDSNYGNTGIFDVATSTFTIGDWHYQGVWSSLIQYKQDDIVLQFNKRWQAIGTPTLGSFIQSEWHLAIPYFFPDDVGIVINTKLQNGDFAQYLVTAVSVTGEFATLSPALTTNSIAVTFAYQHRQLNRRFSIKSPQVTFQFTPDMLNGLITLIDPKEDRNKGTFKIVAVESTKTVYLEDTGYSLIDENQLLFQVSISGTQSVLTDKHLYLLPLGVPVKEEIKDLANVNSLTFNAFYSLSNAITVSDYVSDPLWWHNITIPENVMRDTVDNSVRKQVTSQLIEHVAGALDGAIAGDLGLYAGCDDEGNPGVERTGSVTWLGDNWLKITVASNIPPVSIRDINQYFYCNTEGSPFKGAYKIIDVLTDGQTFRVENFPPLQAFSRVPPETFIGTLPMILFRRTVAFILMDKLLKYHFLRIQISPTILDSNFLAQIETIIGQAKPAHVFIYLDATTTFTDLIHVREELTIAYGPYIADLFHVVDNTLTSATTLSAGDYFSYVTATSTTMWPGGNPGTFPVSIIYPFTVDYQRIVFFRLLATTGGRHVVEGLDYTVNYVTNTVTCLVNLDAGPLTTTGIICGIVNKGSPSPWWSGQNSDLGSPIWIAEMPIGAGGIDPLIRINSGMNVNDQAIIDRPLMIAIT